MVSLLSCVYCANPELIQLGFHTFNALHPRLMFTLHLQQGLFDYDIATLTARNGLYQAGAHAQFCSHSAAGTVW